MTLRCLIFTLSSIFLDYITLHYITFHQHYMIILHLIHPIYLLHITYTALVDSTLLRLHLDFNRHYIILSTSFNSTIPYTVQYSALLLTFYISHYIILSHCLQLRYITSYIIFYYMTWHDIVLYTLHCLPLFCILHITLSYNPSHITLNYITSHYIPYNFTLHTSL